MVIHPAIGFVNFDNADQIKGSADDHRITFGSVNSGPKIIVIAVLKSLNLLRKIILTAAFPVNICSGAV
jgi:hypothetical protein